jgi:hypothetical protein
LSRATEVPDESSLSWSPGAEGSHSRTDPDLIGPDQGDTNLSADEAALHVIP